uniref:Uncharacterized protein n=1 Tax=Desertifilum tharense IPPAS B-1220 TaxID=1781255 RepID=A0ACD5GRN2_9CYAN
MVAVPGVGVSAVRGPQAVTLKANATADKDVVRKTSGVEGVQT